MQPCCFLISVKWRCQIVCSQLLNYPEEQPGLQKLNTHMENASSWTSLEDEDAPVAPTVCELQLAWECLPLTAVLTRFLFKSSTLCSHLDDPKDILMQADAKDILCELHP